MRIATIMGARPQFIKAAVVSRAFSTCENMHEIGIHTGQHYDANMSDIFFEELDIPHPKYHLGIGGGTHGQQTGQMLQAIERVLIDEHPDWVLVYGDTNSTLAGALAAAKLHIPVAHVEAGLRSFNKRMPEEINRILADHCADRLFVPTESAARQLATEGIAADSIELVGDVMYDATLYYTRKLAARQATIETFGVTPGQYMLATIHRAENTDDPTRLTTIFAGLVAASHILPVILPLHPRTRARLAEQLTAPMSDQLHIIPPIGYLDMLLLEQKASLIITDSGGVQKEAYFHRVPCVTLRQETEWTELVDTGWNVLCPITSGTQIARCIQQRIGSAGQPVELYGDGHAAELIAASLLLNGA